MLRSFKFALALTMASCLAAAGCATRGEFPSEDAPMRAGLSVEGYRLEPGNRVRVVVFNEANLSGDFTLDSVGNIALPLIGNVPSGGLTARELAQRIAMQLKEGDILQDPNVSVEVQTFRPFYVLGEVRAPGEFPYTAGMTVLSAVARAGGYDYRAREGEVVLVRVVDNAQKEYRATELTPILPGDVVKVLERRY